MDNPTMGGSVAVEAGPAPMGFVERLTGIYFEPTKTFADINRKPSWIVMFIVMSLVTIAATYTLIYRLDRELYAQKAAAMSMRYMKKFMSAQQLEQAQAASVAAASQPQSTVRKILPVVTTPLAQLVGYIIMAAILLLAFVIAGSGVSFKKALVATIWGTAPPGILVTLLGIVFMFVKSPQDLDINFVNNVMSNLGMLADPDKQPVMNSLLSSIDIFSLWSIILLSIGFAAMSDGKLTPKKAAVPIVSLWALYVLLKMGFWAIMG